MSNELAEDAHPSFPTPATSELVLVRVLKAAADPARLVILAQLADGEFHSCSPNEYPLTIHKSTLSHHFKTLRESGLTRTRVVGHDHYVRLRREDLEGRWPRLLEGLLQAAQAET